jgi:hypothetical protein
MGLFLGDLDTLHLQIKLDRDYLQAYPRHRDRANVGGALYWFQIAGLRPTRLQTFILMDVILLVKVNHARDMRTLNEYCVHRPLFRWETAQCVVVYLHL